MMYMQETKDSQTYFQNGKQLLNSCILKLKENQRGETGGNVALCPTVIVMMGSKSRYNTKYIKSTLDDNWNNARFLQYLNVVKTDSGWQCFLLSDTEEQSIYSQDAQGQSICSQDAQEQSIYSQNMQGQSICSQNAQGQSICSQDTQGQSICSQDTQGQSICSQDVKRQSICSQDAQGQSIYSQDVQEQSICSQNAQEQSIYSQDAREQSIYSQGTQGQEQGIQSRCAQEQGVYGQCMQDMDDESLYPCVWKLQGMDWDRTLSSAVVKMLETEEKIFSKRTTIKMEYILDATEADSISYFELFCQTENALQADELKTLYLMLDQRPGAGHVQASDMLLRYMVDYYEESEESGTIYLLSNYLQSGQMLGDSRIWQNYRLAADLMLLGGSRSKAQGVVQKLFRGFKTVSYALVTKPVDEIAAVSLRTLLQELYETERRKLYRELSVSDISGKLQMDRYHGFSFLEELFGRKIYPKFPKETDWKYLPFGSVQDYRKFFKSMKVTMESANMATCGAAAAFLEKYYLLPVREFFSDEKEMAQCRDEISRLLTAQFAYFELLYLKEHTDEWGGIILAEYQFAGFGPKDDACQRLHTLAIYESRRLFYRKMKQMVAAEFGQLVQRAQKFRDLYAACIKEVRQECIVTGDESKSVEKFYGRIASEFVEQHRKAGEEEPAFPEVFCVANDRPQLLGAVWDVFLELIGDKVFDCDFEQEVDYRMDGMDEKQRHAFVAEELRKKLEGSRRLKNSIEIPMTEAGCYYMVNASADYARTLEQADSGEYVLFDLSRTDCIEQLEIYDIIRPQLLHLGCVRDAKRLCKEKMQNGDREQTTGSSDQGADLRERGGEYPAALEV